MSRLAHLDGIQPIDAATIAALESDARVGRDLKARYRVICRVTGAHLGAYPTLTGACGRATIAAWQGIEALIVDKKEV